MKPTDQCPNCDGWGCLSPRPNIGSSSSPEEAHDIVQRHIVAGIVLVCSVCEGSGRKSRKGPDRVHRGPDGTGRIERYPPETAIQRVVLEVNLHELHIHGEWSVIIGGSFDPLHGGHIAAFEYIDNYDERGRRDVFVALQTDDVIRQRKGPNRPVVPFAERASILASLRNVWCVVENPHLDFGWLVRHIRPKYVATGEEYRESGIPEDDAIKEIGAEMIWTPRQGSSSELIDHMTKNLV